MAIYSSTHHKDAQSTGRWVVVASSERPRAERDDHEEREEEVLVLRRLISRVCSLKRKSASSFEMCATFFFTFLMLGLELGFLASSSCFDFSGGY